MINTKYEDLVKSRLILNKPAKSDKIQMEVG